MIDVRHPRIAEAPHTLPPLPPNLNERAMSLVIDSIGKYPQGWYSGWVIADSLVMQTEGPPPGYATGIGIMELAAIQPDPEFCHAGVNALHKAYGIDKHVLPHKAARFVLRGAMMTLEQLRIVTVHYANAMETVTHPLLLEDIYLPTTFRCPEEVINRNPAHHLFSLLRTAKDLRVEVAGEVMNRAEKVRRGSRVQQQTVVARYQH